MDRRRGVMVLLRAPVLLALAGSHRADVAESPWLFVPRATSPRAPPRGRPVPLPARATDRSGRPWRSACGRTRRRWPRLVRSRRCPVAARRRVVRNHHQRRATGARGPGTRCRARHGYGPRGAVLFGGFPDGLARGPPHGDTWAGRAAPGSWSARTRLCGPGGRGLFAMAGNGTQGRCSAASPPPDSVDDTWAFDGTDLVPDLRRVAPLVRGRIAAAAAMAWEAASSSCSSLGPTWTAAGRWTTPGPSTVPAGPWVVARPRGCRADRRRGG